MPRARQAAGAREKVLWAALGVASPGGSSPGAAGPSPDAFEKPKREPLDRGRGAPSGRDLSWVRRAEWRWSR